MNKWAIIAVVILLLIIGGYYFFGKTAYAPSNPGTSTTSAVSGAPSPASTTNSSNAISIENFSFNPSSLTVKAGTTVTWTNNDSVAHTITSDNGAFESGQVQPGSTFSFTFAKAGTFEYHCSIHPTMKASVVVQ